MTADEFRKIIEVLDARIKALEARQAPQTYNPMAGPIPWTSNWNEGVTDAEVVK